MGWNIMNDDENESPMLNKYLETIQRLMNQCQSNGLSNGFCMHFSLGEYANFTRIFLLFFSLALKSMCVRIRSLSYPRQHFHNNDSLIMNAFNLIINNASIAIFCFHFCLLLREAPVCVCIYFSLLLFLFLRSFSHSCSTFVMNFTQHIRSGYLYGPKMIWCMYIKHRQ